MLNTDEKAHFSQLLDDIEQISAAASHDLRDALRVALQQCALARQGCDAAAQGALAEAERCIEDTLANVAALRQYAYLAQDMERAQPLSLEGVLQMARLNNAAVMSACEGRIDWQLPAPILLTAKPKQLEMMFTHLFENGLKYNPNPRPHVVVHLRDTPAGLECVVQDNGDGMEPEFAYLVFGLFKRVEPDGPVRGCGAGLSFAKKVAENHGGSISLEADPGYGCRVKVLFPHALRHHAQESGFSAAMPFSSRG
jgi:signal transduction histidine kinase